ncbi:hypothetical protein HYS28_01460 [Candidatus Uhrbacteria bacterium]|nr:hypothetical protein [Candidatus Uhrbacteria bacterium]
MTLTAASVAACAVDLVLALAVLVAMIRWWPETRRERLNRRMGGPDLRERPRSC